MKGSKTVAVSDNADTTSGKMAVAQTLAVAMAVILTFWGTWSKLFSQWSRSDDYAYGMMIPPICLLLVWERRKALAALALRADLRGLLLMLFAVILFGLGELGAELFTTRAAVITLFIGALWWMHGRAVVAHPGPAAAAALFHAAPARLRVPQHHLPVADHGLDDLCPSAQRPRVSGLPGGQHHRYGVRPVSDRGGPANGLRFILPLLCMGVGDRLFQAHGRVETHGC